MVQQQPVPQPGMVTPEGVIEMVRAALHEERNGPPMPLLQRPYPE